MPMNQLIVTDLAQTAGCISYWRIASDTNLTTLTAAWKKHGLAVDQLPKPPKDEVALGRAVNDQAAKRRLVRPLARRGAWAIVDETVVEGQAPTYRTIVTVHMESWGPRIASMPATTAQEVRTLDVAIGDAYAAHRNTLAHHDVSSWLLDIGYKLGAVSLRDSGGVYFVPRKEVDIWNKVANAVEESGSSIFRIPAMRTAEAVAAITDAITNEAAALSQSIEDELAKTGDDALGARALKTRVKTLEEMIAKLGTYEELIGRGLNIRDRVMTLSASVTTAALTAMSEPEAA